MEALSSPHGDAPAGRAAVLNAVKRAGPLSADALAKRLGITAAAVRQHLAALQDEGLIAPSLQPQEGRGRPRALWSVTEAAQSYFPDSHQLLATDLLKQMHKAFGDEGLNKLLRARTKDQEAAYRAEMDRAATLKGRLETLARIRTREGYMAQVTRDGAGFLFVENHCPVCAAAKLCQGLCREELALFQRLLGKEVSVERTDHILAGARRCAYRIAPAP